jgi:hypothetical protein
MEASLRVSLATAASVFSIGGMICILAVWHVSSVMIFGFYHSLASSGGRRIPGGLPVCSGCSPSRTLGGYVVRVARDKGESTHNEFKGM